MDPFGMMRWFPVMFFLVFFLVLGVFVYVFVSIARSHRKNSSAPRLTVGAKVVAKRQEYRRSSGNSMGHTWYFVTFEVQSGDRMELEIEQSQYGLIAESDVGMLTFQGTRFLQFERI